MWLANLFGGGIVLGCVFRAYDAYDGLSGFSTMNEKEKAKWDIIGGRFITKLMIISGVIVVAGGILIRTIWRCNSKYKKGCTCQTPHLYETAIQKAFVDAFNQLYGHRNNCWRITTSSFQY